MHVLRGAALAVVLVSLGPVARSGLRLAVGIPGPDGAMAQGRPGGQGEQFPVVDVALSFLWRLAAAQAVRPDLDERLGSASPTSAPGILRNLDLPFDSFDRALGALQVAPVFLFGPSATDIADLARRFDRTLDLRVPRGPPIELRGTRLKTLLLFEPRSPTEDPPLPRVVPAYTVDPSQWRSNGTAEHQVCLDDQQSPVPLQILVTKLTYGDGTTDSERVDIEGAPRMPCPLMGYQQFTAVRVSQPTRSAADPPLVIASCFVINRQGTPSNVIAIPLPTRP